ncbi:MAG TPA: hypothetical protein VFM46_12490 [Pseudomonadales bacterium]|nr:hypothetical protein [Pseudomonadales bacterium]
MTKMFKSWKKWVAAASALAYLSASAQVINPSPPSTATAGTGLSQAGSVISLNYAVPNSPFTGSLSASGLTSILPITGSINAGAFNYGALSYSDTGLFASFATTLNDHANLTIQNQSNGASAKAMIGLANDLGTSTAHRAEFGINSSGVSGANSFQIGNGAFLRSITGDLAIGTTTNNAIHFLTNASTTDALTISGAGAISGAGLAVITRPITTLADTSTSLTATTSPQTIDSFPVATFRSCHYIVQITQGTNYQSAELNVITDGTNTFLTSYGLLSTTGSQFAIYSATISAGNLILNVSFNSGATAGSAKVSATRIVI